MRASSDDARRRAARESQALVGTAMAAREQKQATARRRGTRPRRSAERSAGCCGVAGCSNMGHYARSGSSSAALRGLEYVSPRREVASAAWRAYTLRRVPATGERHARATARRRRAGAVRGIATPTAGGRSTDPRSAGRHLPHRPGAGAGLHELRRHPGDEFVGEIVALGEGAEAAGLAIGQRVVGEINAACGA